MSRVTRWGETKNTNYVHDRKPAPEVGGNEVRTGEDYRYIEKRSVESKRLNGLLRVHKVGWSSKLEESLE